MRYQLRYVRMSCRITIADAAGLPCTSPGRDDGRVSPAASARLGGLWASDLVGTSDDLASLADGGRWAVAVPYAGSPVLARFDRWEPTPPAGPPARWHGPAVSAWTSSMDEAAYCRGVESIRSAVVEGSVYQANLCRIMSAPLPEGPQDVAGLHALLEQGNPAPFGSYLHLPDLGVHIASASPELFLSVGRRSDGRWVRSGPIKGTGATAADLTEKDSAENVMIVDLVRNDLARVTDPGTVGVPALLRVDQHPGLVHLVSLVEGRLRAEVTWPEIFAATFPPGSVTGAPKSSALRIIDELEPAPRDFYCGAFGWIDADSGEAELAVAIRTFWIRDHVLHFGTGAGITWASDAASEWRETELKARRLVGVASGVWQGDHS